MGSLSRREFLKAGSFFVPAVMAGKITSSTFATVESSASGYIEPRFDVTLDMAHRGTVEIDMKLLESYCKQPESVVEFYRTIRQDAMSSATLTFAENPAVFKACKQYGITHLGGPMLSDIRPDGVSVWVRTIEPSNVTVVAVSQDGGKKKFGPEMSSAASDLTAAVKLKGLQPDSFYTYEVYIDGQKLELKRQMQFKTLPVSVEDKRFRLAFGSCFHKSGVHNPNLLGQVRERGNQAMLFIGDSAVDDRENNAARHRTDYLLRDLSPAWQGFSAGVAIYAAWDDHDYFNNDLSGIPRERYTIEDVLAIRKVWEQNWNNPSCGQNGEGIYFRARIGPADVIMLDTRSQRKREPGMKNAYLGDWQTEWLKQELLKCSGPFVIISSGTMWSDYISNGKDSWGIWDPAGREELLQYIEDNRIPGVLLISGDRHGARAVKIPRPSGYHFYEFEPACLGGMTGPEAWGSSREMQLFGHVGLKAFGEFEFDCKESDPTVTFRLIDETGKTLEQVLLHKSKLDAGKS